MKRLLALTLLAAACGNAPVVESGDKLDRPHVIKGVDLRRQCDHTLEYAGDYPSFSAGEGPSVSFDLCSPAAALHQIKGWFVSGGSFGAFARTCCMPTWSTRTCSPGCRGSSRRHQW